MVAAATLLSDRKRQIGLGDEGTHLGKRGSFSMGHWIATCRRCGGVSAANRDDWVRHSAADLAAWQRRGDRIEHIEGEFPKRKGCRCYLEETGSGDVTP